MSDTTRIEPPADGLYDGIPAAVYHRWNGANASVLKRLAVSPLHARHWLDHPATPTPDMLLGTATHAAILEPAAFAATYTVAGRCEAATAGGRQCGNSGRPTVDGRQLCGVHGKGVAFADATNVLAADDAATIDGMRSALAAHPTAGPLLALPGRTEASAAWTDDCTGVACKARIDRLASNDFGMVCIDLKTAVDASGAGFGRAAVSHGYRRQACHYLAGLATLGVAVDVFVFLVVEKAPPFAVGCYQIHAADLADAAGLALLMAGAGVTSET